MRVTRTEVLIVGAGVAGLVAANRLAQLGRKPLVLEKGSESKYWCNSRITGGALHICYRDAGTPPAELEVAIAKANGGTGNPELAGVVAANAKRFIDFLSAEGLRFIKAGPQEYQNRVLAPPRPNYPGLHWEGRGGDVMLRTLEQSLLKRGGSLRRGAKVTNISEASGRWLVDVDGPDGSEQIDTAVVIIADGGFQADPILLRRYVTKHPDRLLQRGAATAAGDGIRMAEALGAELVDMSNFYGHPMARDAMNSNKLTPYPFLDGLVYSGIVIGPDGLRFCDEGNGGVYVANSMARLDDPLSAVAVFDSRIWEGPGKEGAIPPNPHLPREGATVEACGSIAQLAEKLGVSPTALANTVDEYNKAVKAGDFAALSYGRTTAKYKAMPIENAPFYAVRLCVGITYTMGGIAIDGKSRVLRTDKSAIKGLYAVGTVTGGVEGGPKAGYVGGLITSGTTALAAAEDIVAGHDA